MDMDDIDFWTFDTLKPHQNQEILDRPQSTISTLPSEDGEDEMIDLYENDLEDSYNYNDVCGTIISGSFAANSGLNNESIVNNPNVKYWENLNEVISITKSTNDIGVSLDLHAQDDKLESSSEQLEKYELKKEKNRQSAKRSRERKKEVHEALVQKNTQLKQDNAKLRTEVGKLEFLSAYLNVQIRNHIQSNCIQEQGDDTFFKTGAAKDVPWTQEDDETVELIDSFNIPGLTRKYPVEETQYESQLNVYTLASNYNYFNEQTNVDHCAASKMLQG
ncbi:hypothetical protein BgiBS90_001890 [Biomphalaria glabrata]|uniref:BZIP domain-containing protein n=1 Tax=Biomphalaria glabrata TaxID=6526 RepID=A0A2C9KL90_BIOGL|nr:hypothetical protein BgiBS90_001890 [Biomphalaria glabrata]